MQASEAMPLLNLIDGYLLAGLPGPSASIDDPLYPQSVSESRRRLFPTGSPVNKTGCQSGYGRHSIIKVPCCWFDIFDQDFVCLFVAPFHSRQAEAGHGLRCWIVQDNHAPVSHDDDTVSR